MTFNEMETNIHKALEKFTGRASVAIEIEGHMVDINGGKTMRAASVIKLPILLEGYRQIDEGKFSINEKIAIGPRDKVGGSGILSHLESLEELSFTDILMLMTIVSDNTASNLAIKQLGFEAINRFCAELGCTSTILGRHFMDAGAMEKGKDNTTTAHDMLRLLKSIDEDGILTAESRKRVLETLKQQQFKTNLHGRIDEDGDVTIYSKSGGLPGVVNDVGIFELQGRKAYAAVLLGDLPDSHTGQEIIAEIGWLVYQFLSGQE